MHFREFWELLATSLAVSKVFETIKQSKKFQAKYIKGFIVVTPQSTGKSVKITKSATEKIWENECTLPESERFKPVNYNGVVTNSSYILSIMKQMLKDYDIECF